MRKIIHETIIPPDYDVVDFGCGVGFSCARNGRCVGVDSSRQMLRVARLRRPALLLPGPFYLDPAWGAAERTRSVPEGEPTASGIACRRSHAPRS